MLSQTAEYALRAMAWLALTPERMVSTGELSKRTQVPSPYLAKVLQQLAAGDLIVGRRGVGGGYKLNRPARQITLMDVINAVSPIRRITACPLGITEHGANLCPLHRRADKAAQVVIELFDGDTLADLLEEPGAITPLCDRETMVHLGLSAGGASA